MKTCSKCGECKPLDQFHRRSASKDGLQNECKSCKRQDQIERMKTEKYREVARKWREGHPGYQTNWNRLNPEASAESVRKWRENHPERWKESTNKSNRKKIKKMDNSYIKRLISRGEIPFSSIPKSLVEVKRLQLQIKRLLKEKAK